MSRIAGPPAHGAGDASEANGVSRRQCFIHRVLAQAAR
jgi:hypothetical protein